MDKKIIWEHTNYFGIKSIRLLGKFNLADPFYTRENRI